MIELRAEARPIGERTPGGRPTPAVPIRRTVLPTGPNPRSRLLIQLRVTPDKTVGVL